MNLCVTSLIHNNLLYSQFEVQKQKSCLHNWTVINSANFNLFYCSEKKNNITLAQASNEQ
jgi:hypothetical protein